MATFLGREWSREALTRYVGSMDQLAGIHATEAVDGRSRGSRMFEVRTGSGLTFRVLADRALDISACRFRGIPLTWASSAGEVHPAYYEAQGLGWLRSFQGGLFATCGLDHFGSPSADTGDEFGIHGRVGNLPAYEVSYQAGWADDEYALEITGKVRQTRLFGENLVLQRRITTRLGSNQIKIEDRVTNEGFNSQPHMILYHCNFGFPLIDEDARLHLDTKETNPRDADAEAGLDEWRSFQKPTSGYREQVFRHVPEADSAGRVKVTISNPKLDFDMRLTYSGETLPHLFQWKMMGQGAYVLGIEPANSSAIQGRAAARERDDLPHLEPGESRSYELNFEVGQTKAGAG